MWKTINEEPDYEIDDSGKVRNRKTKHVKSLRKDRYGYLRVTLYPSGKTYTVHRLVAKAFLDNPENYPVVNHLNGDKEDNRAVNLEWCTVKRNTHHAIGHGFFKIKDIVGEKNPASVFTENLVREIKYGKYSDMTTKDIAESTGMRYEAVRRIRTGQHWKHV